MSAVSTGSKKSKKSKRSLGSKSPLRKSLNGTLRSSASRGSRKSSANSAKRRKSSGKKNYPYKMVSDSARVSVNTNYQVSQKNTDKLWQNFERDLLGKGSPYVGQVNEEGIPMTRNDL